MATQPSGRGRGRPPHPDILTPREWQVLDLLRQGLTNERIAERLDISFATAKYHVAEIISKLGVQTREEAAAWQPEAAAPQRWWQRATAPLLAALGRAIPFTPAKAAIAAGAISAVTGLAIAGALLFLAGDGQDADTAVEPTAPSAQRAAGRSAQRSTNDSTSTPTPEAPSAPPASTSAQPGQVTQLTTSNEPPPRPLDAQAHSGLTEPASVDSGGNIGDGYSLDPSLSDDGRFVLFASFATNLVPDDANNFCDRNNDNIFEENCADIFMHDRDTGTTTLVSLNSSGTQANDSSSRPSLSSDGRFVVFESEASNLAVGDTGCPNTTVVSSSSGLSSGCPEIFLRDRLTATTERVSTNNAGEPANGDSLLPSVSDDGRFVAFQSTNSSNLGPPGNNSGVFVRDRQTAVTTFAGNGIFPRISSNGRFVVFQSDASEIVPGDTNGASDIFVHDLQLSVTERVSVDSLGNQATDDDPLLGAWLSSSFFPSISGDGRFVAFVSKASNLVAGDTNGLPDVFVHDRETDVTSRVSVHSSGSQSNGDSYSSLAISDDGRFIAFTSFASNLVEGDSSTCPDTPDSRSCGDVFLHDRQASTTERISVSTEGTEANGDSTTPTGISADGRFVVFQSLATNLVPGDTNSCLPSPPQSCQDIFVRERLELVGAPAPSPVTSRTPASAAASPLALSADRPAQLPAGRLTTVGWRDARSISGLRNYVRSRLDGIRKWPFLRSAKLTSASLRNLRPLSSQSRRS